jgi:hypothetical protein
MPKPNFLSHSADDLYRLVIDFGYEITVRDGKLLFTYSESLCLIVLEPESYA